MLMIWLFKLLSRPRALSAARAAGSFMRAAILRILKLGLSQIIKLRSGILVLDAV